MFLKNYTEDEQHTRKMGKEYNWKILREETQITHLLKNQLQTTNNFFLKALFSFKDALNGLVSFLLSGMD